VLVFEIKYGLLIGIGVSMLLVVMKHQVPYIAVLGNIPSTELYEDVSFSKAAVELEGIKVLRYEAPIYYANTENFVDRIVKYTKADVLKSVADIAKKRAEHSDLAEWLQRSGGGGKRPRLTNMARAEYQKRASEEKLKLEIGRIRGKSPLRSVVVDMSCVNSIDTMGVEALVTVKELLREAGIGMQLSCVKSRWARGRFEGGSIFERFCLFEGSLFVRLESHAFRRRFSYEDIYPSTHDAVRRLLAGEEDQCDEVRIRF